jgi:hypothetical protein
MILAPSVDKHINILKILKQNRQENDFVVSAIQFNTQNDVCTSIFLILSHYMRLLLLTNVVKLDWKQIIEHVLDDCCFNDKKTVVFFFRSSLHDGSMRYQCK